MSDTEQKNEIEPNAETEETAGVEDTAADVTAAESDGAPAEAAPAEEPAATAEEPPAEAESAAGEAAAPAESEEPVEEAPAADSGEPAVEKAPAAESGEPAAEEASAAATEETTAAPQPAVEYTYDDLKDKTVAQMREIAEGLGENDAVQGYTTMHKEELLVALCNALDIEAHEHHEVVGIDKAAVKSKIRELKAQREALIEAKDSKQLKIVRRRIRSLKRKIHKATV